MTMGVYSNKSVGGGGRKDKVFLKEILGRIRNFGSFLIRIRNFGAFLKKIGPRKDKDFL